MIRIHISVTDCHIEVIQANICELIQAENVAIRLVFALSSDAPRRGCSGGKPESGPKISVYPGTDRQTLVYAQTVIGLSAKL